MKFKTSNEPLAAFSYSSLTDIVMLLLIFFLLTSQFVIQTGVKVKLPGSKTNEQSAPANLIITITSDGAVFLGQEPVALDQLPAKLSVIKTKTTEDNLVIRADKSVALDMVIKVIDAAKATGINKFTIQTQKEKI
jgi:biopolymer transport protein ExbD